MKRILLDLDGVLCDFVTGAARLHGKDPASVTHWDFIESWGLTASDFWVPMGRAFWADLPLTSEANAVVAECEVAVGSSNVCLLTSPCETDGCTDGKLDWIKRHLPQFRRRVLVGGAKQFCASPSSLLVDDHDKNCDAFIAAGGRACLFPRPWNRAAAEAGAPLAALRKSLKEFIDGE